MRVFAKPMPIDRLSVEARILYSAFLVFMGLGTASALWLYADDDLGLDATSVKNYYLGNDADPETNTATPNDSQNNSQKDSQLDLQIDLPDDTGAQQPIQETMQEIRIAKPMRQIVETFHFHLFSVPICLLIVGHIFMMCRLSTRTKATIIAAGSIATLLHLLAPVAVRALSPAWAWLFAPSAVVMLITWLWMSIKPLIDLWRPIPPPSNDADA